MFAQVIKERQRRILLTRFAIPHPDESVGFLRRECPALENFGLGAIPSVGRHKLARPLAVVLKPVKVALDIAINQFAGAELALAVRAEIPHDGNLAFVIPPEDEFHVQPFERGNSAEFHLVRF